MKEIAKKEAVGAEFTAEQFKIDGWRFVNCTFKGVRLVYFGLGPVEFQNCQFINCTLGVAGPASATVSLLSSLLRQQSGGGNALGTEFVTAMINGKLANFDVKD